MKKYLFMAVAAIAMLSSCSSDNEVFNSEVKKALTFTATMESIGGTRAEFDSEAKCAKWEEGDMIYIMGIDASNIATEASYVASGTNGTSTTFEPATPGQEVSGQTFRAFFPTYILDGGACVIPAEIDETWAEGKFNMPMFAMSNTTTLAFQNLCGVLAIKVNKDQLERVEFITISSSNRKLNGWIQPMPNSEGKLSVGLVSPEKDDEFDDLAIHYTSVVEIGEEGNVFYVPIPPSYNLDIDLNTRTMSLVADPYKDLKILLNDGEGHIKTMTTKKDKEILVERNKIYNITFKDNTPPTTGTAKAKINGVDVDVNWVQLWAGGPKFAEYNIGTSEDLKQGNLITFYDAIKTGNDYAWGANWRTPRQDDMDELCAASHGNSDAKVTCERVIVGGINGFIFTGKEAGYTDNKVFFPADEIDLYKSQDRDITSHYWTCTYDATAVQVLYLASNARYTEWKSTGFEWDNYYVRPVLNEAK